LHAREGAYRNILGLSEEMSGSGSLMGRQSHVRIIGGRWRGRKLTFTATEGLRPTGDRIKETLFNWLMPHVEGARCLDLFAGSGALGLEALSRGASHCDFVDSSKTAVRQVRQHLQTLDALGNGDCHLSSALKFLQTAVEPYDIVFIDPPFKLKLASQVTTALARQQLLSESALVYLETANSEPIPAVPEGWKLHREKVSGAVSYRLFTRDRVEQLP
jgi:16S rRNA (guanine966-N2)-methyltransferase